MKQVKIMNIILEIGNKMSEGFTRNDFYNALKSHGLSYTKAYSFYLTHMKAAGYVINVSHGKWMLTENGKNLNKIDRDLASRIMSIKYRNEEEVSISKPMDIASLILEIKKVNPRADISSFASML